MTEELLATHQIISLFETSKGLADRIFDELSGVFINLDKDGVILRANRAVALYLNIEHEDVLNTHMSRLFSPENWEKFQARLQTVVQGGKESIEFELPIETGASKSRSFLWQISVLSKKIEQTKGIYTCIGRDVSEVKEAQAALVTLEKDLELTKAMQDLLLPEGHDFRMGNLSLAAFYRAATVAGGDYWWMNLEGDTLWMIVADVTGHGPGPAMVTSMVAGCVETLKAARAAAIRHVDLPVILGAINQRLGSLRGRPYWMTACAIELNLNDNTMHWWSAGAPAIVILRKEGNLEYLSDGSSPLGMGELNLSQGQSELCAGDRMLLLTDGVLELKNSHEREFGDRLVAKFLRKVVDQSAVDARDQLIAHLDQYRGEMPADDDITFVVIDRL